MKRVLSRSVAVLRAIADMAERAPSVGEGCRVLADAIADELSEAAARQKRETPPKRGKSTPTPTAPFSEADTALVVRKLRRLDK